MHEPGHKGARHGIGRHDSSDSEGGTGKKPLGARTTTHTRRPKTSLGSVRGRQLQEQCHRRCCTYSSNTWDNGSDSAGRNRVKPDTELCMRPGPNSRGRQIRVLLAGTGGGILQPVHKTRTTTSTGKQHQHPELTETDTWTTTGCTSAGCSATDPLGNKSTKMRLRQPYTNQFAAAATTRPLPDHKQAGQDQTRRACEGRKENSFRG